MQLILYHSITVVSNECMYVSNSGHVIMWLLCMILFIVHKYTRLCFNFSDIGQIILYDTFSV